MEEKERQFYILFHILNIQKYLHNYWGLASVARCRVHLLSHHGPVQPNKSADHSCVDLDQYQVGKVLLSITMHSSMGRASSEYWGLRSGKRVLSQVSRKASSRFRDLREGTQICKTEGGGQAKCKRMGAGLIWRIKD